MRKKIVSAVLIICLILLTILISRDHMKRRTDEKTDMDAVSSEADAAEETVAKTPSAYELNEFDRSLIDYLCTNGYYDSEFVVSPAAFRASLCLAAEGAEGNTRTELVTAAGFSGMDELDEWYRDYRNVTDGRICFAGASVWNDADRLGRFTDNYETRLKQQYGADSYVCTADELTSGISDWLGSKTDGAIPSAAKDVSGASSVLVSTLYITAPIDAEQTGEFLYAEVNGTQMLSLPISGNLSFVCFTGNRTDMFDKLAEFGENKETVRVSMTDFELRSDFDSTDLLNFLLTRGVGDSLNGQTANFYNMCQDSDWFLQEMIQSARISFLTADKAAESSDADREIKEFAADGTFSFIIFYGFSTSDQQALVYGQLNNG